MASHPFHRSQFNGKQLHFITSSTMKLSNSWSSLLLLLAAAASTTSAEYTPPTTNYGRCLTADEAADITTALSNGVEVDLFPEKVSSDQSVYWEIDYRSTYKILKNTQDTVNTTYLLYQCGLPEPTPETHPELEGITFDSVFSVPHTGGLLVTATTQIPNIEILNRRSQVVAFAVSENLVSSPCLSQQIIPAGKEDGSITFLPLYNDTVIEDYVTEHPDTLVFGGAWDTDLKMKNKVIISDVGESPEEALDQNRDVNEAIFEWLEVYGSLFNEEGLAGGVVSDTKGRYNCHTDNAAMIAESRRELRDVEERRLEEGSRVSTCRCFIANLLNSSCLLSNQSTNLHHLHSFFAILNYKRTTARGTLGIPQPGL
eukprot:g5318.t1.1.5e174189 g5318  g5318.t1 contig2:251934-253046(-)